MSLVRIARLDTAVDFVIESDHFDLENYKSSRPKYAKATNITYNEKGAAQTWTGIYSNKDGFPTLYDKSAQAAKKKVKYPPLPKTKRFEYRLERKSLTRAHIHTLADITHQKFEYALRKGWEYSGLGSPVHHPESWIEIITKSSLDQKVQWELIGFLLTNARGEEPQNLEECERLKECARSLGISFKRSLEKNWFMATYLDLESQSLIELKSELLPRQGLVHQGQ